MCLIHAISRRPRETEADTAEHDETVTDTNTSALKEASRALSRISEDGPSPTEVGGSLTEHEIDMFEAVVKQRRFSKKADIDLYMAKMLGPPGQTPPPKHHLDPLSPRLAAIAKNAKERTYD